MDDWKRQIIQTIWKTWSYNPFIINKKLKVMGKLHFFKSIYEYDKAIKERQKCGRCKWFVENGCDWFGGDKTKNDNCPVGFKPKGEKK